MWSPEQIPESSSALVLVHYGPDTCFQRYVVISLGDEIELGLRSIRLSRLYVVSSTHQCSPCM